MVKKVKDWTSVDHWIHAKGYLEGYVMGLVTAATLMSLGWLVYAMFQ